MDKLRREYHTVSAHQRAVREAISRSGATGPRFYSMVPIQNRGFAAPKKTKSAKAEKKTEEAEPTAEKTTSEQDDHYEKDEYDENQAEFNNFRRFMMLFGKFLKFSIWGATAIFMYHYYLVTMRTKPEESLGATEPFLYYAF